MATPILTRANGPQLMARASCLCVLVFWVLALITMGFASTGKAGSLLSNPSFEADGLSGSSLLGWTTYGANHYNESDHTIAHTGTNYFKVYQAFNGVVNRNGVYQDYISGPGATYSADGWAYTAASDALAGANAAWIEITFRDASANVMALYRSALITTNLIATGGFPKSQWVDLAVTNQYDINSFQITNRVTQLVAPAGTYFIRYQLMFQGDANNSSGSIYFDDLNLVSTGTAPYGDMNIVWNDEFDGAAINNSIWTYELGGGGWGNNELEFYTNRTNNAFVQDGLLHIVARQESSGSYNYTSARMKSQGRYSFTYGRLEWRAKFPAGVGFWPALWLLGNNISTIGWPQCGEIDVFENTGTNTVMVQSSIHSGGDATGYYNFFDNGITNFHTYTLDWTTNAMLFYVDGHLFESQTNWTSTGGAYPFPFNQPFFIIMNFAVGGNYVSNPSVTDINTHSIFPSEVLVDYVRVYNTTVPFRLAISQTSTNLLLTWPSNIVAHVQAQTNFSSNWYSVNTTSNPLPVSPTNGSAFFRLSTP
jgi:beta-glucanase (GH16 family)